MSVALPFGQAHTRQPGAFGEGWTVSIDDVVPLERLDVEGAGSDGECLAIVGTATLDSLEDGVTSTGFNFPRPAIFHEGVRHQKFAFCDTTALEDQGIGSFGVEVAEGTTFRWFKTVHVLSAEYDFAAIEDTIYTMSGGDIQVGSRRESLLAGGPDDGPYTFGEPHTREPGVFGEGWTVSIDDVVPLKRVDFSDRDCLAIVGTATLDSLEAGLTSSVGFAFPQASLLQAGVKNIRVGHCDASGLEGQGMILHGNAEVTEGTTFRWFQTLEAVQSDFEFAAIEDTRYDP